MAGVPRQYTQPGPGLGPSLAAFWDNIGPALLKDMQTLPERAGSALMQPVQALDRFGRTLTGQEGGYGLEYDPSMGRVAPSGQLFDDANTLAGLVSVGAAPMPKVPNSLGMFGGVMARTADKGALAKAEDMLAKGASRDDIWNETGWFKGVDDQWRFEIPDGGATFKDYAVPSRSAFEKDQIAFEYLKRRGYSLERNSVTGGLKAGDIDKIKPEDYSAAWEFAHGNVSAAPSIDLAKVVTHDRLLEAYPELGLTAVTQDVPNGYAGMSWGGKVGVASAPGVDARSTMLHEVQHEIQNREGFAKGSNKTAAEDVLNDAAQASSALSWRREIEAQAELNPGMGAADLEELVIKDYKALGLKVPSSRVRYMAKASQVQDYSTERLQAAAQAIRYPGEAGMWSRSQIDDAYKRFAGEVEARNVQARRNMTPDQLRATPPWMTQDVPDPLQIVRFGAGAVARPPKLST